MTTEIEEMPPELLERLNGLIEDRIASGFKAVLINTWRSSGPGRYWRAKVSMNDVVVRYYYSPSLERWKRS
jgi:hypothetical protein